MKRFLKNDITLIVFLLLAGGVLGILLGRDVNWDLANYHYYSVWAFLNNRIGFDVMPSGIQSYFNPLIDIPFYILIKLLNNHPYCVTFIQSGYWSISVYITYKISELIFVNKNKNFLIFFALLIGSTGILSILEIGTTFNDLNLSVIILSALYLILKNMKSDRALIFVSSGLLLGLAIGLKSSGLMYAIGILVAEICCFNKFSNPIKVICSTIIGILIGWGISGGWWYVLMLKNFQNPYFPFYNQFFKSPFALESSYLDYRHLPQNIIQAIFYPFYWTKHYTENIVLEFASIDFRHIAMYFYVILFAFMNVFMFKKYVHFKDEFEKIIDNEKCKFLSIFMVVTYVIWINSSGTLRYLQTIELLSGIFIIIGSVYVIALIKNEKFLKPIVIIMSMILLLSTKYSDRLINRSNFENKFIEIENLNLPDNAVLCQLGGFPSAIVMPFQNPKVQFVYLYGEIGNYNFKYPTKIEDKISEIINDKNKEIYLIYSDFEPAYIDWKYVNKFINDKDYSCRKVKNSFQQFYYFCSPKTANKRNIDK